MYILAAAAGIIFVLLVFSSSLLELHTESYPEIILMVLLAIVLSALVALTVTYFVKYDEEAQTTGLTAWSISKAKEIFKGRKVNEREGEVIKANWKIKPGEEETINFSKNDMGKMQAEVGDLVYICDARKRFGGLKSVHAVYGEPHDEDGIVYISDEHKKQAQFVKERILTAEKEM